MDKSSYQGLVWEQMSGQEWWKENEYPGEQMGYTSKGHVGVLLERGEQMTPERKQETDQSKDTTQVWLSEPMSFIEIIYKTMVRGYLKDQK